ncbi:FAD/NAD(P)-binding protein [Streptomyces sp. NPDC096339]|uniref:FAD/NAD(P)-binding protein n=1 Tax=Streptomyces sp. NPDC096339 TaxID=3366086 RepID=UPI00381E4803
MSTPVPPVEEPFRLAVIGGGPRATYALERLSATLDRLGPEGRLEVRVFERSGEFGSGLAHSPSQPRTSYLNRISSQVGFAADETVRGAGPLRPAGERPTLYEWCRRRYESTGEPDFDLGPEDWPKRYVHGLALQDMFGAFVRDLRAHPGVTVRLHAVEVVDLVEDAAPPGGRLRVVTADSGAYPADQVLLLTGHTHHDPELSPRARRFTEFARTSGAAYVPYAYPLDRALPQEITGLGAVVGCAGTGLTAIDEILHLTEGRGGRFEHDARFGLRYVPSGEEPASIVAFSGSGLFTFTRPVNYKEINPELLEHRGVFLTEGAVDRLRESAGVPGGPAGGTVRRQLDFERDVLPVIVLEMAHLHYTTLFGPAAGRLLAERAEPGYREFLAGRRSGAAGPESLQAPLEAAVDEIVAVLEAALCGRPGADPVAVPGLDTEELLARWVGVVFGPDAQAQTLALRADPAALHRAFAGWTSPWLLDHGPAGNRFGWSAALDPIGPEDLTDPDRYRVAVLDFMDRDQHWADQGNLDNPHKAAADGVWRDLRGVISYAVDDAGLTAASQRTFTERYLRHHNRLANGAAPEVMARMQALARHGLLDLSCGPGARVSPDPGSGRFRVDGPVTGASFLLDTLADARLHAFDPARDAAPLYRNLAAAGTLRLWRNESADGGAFEPGGIDLTPESHPVRADGTVERRITLLGPPAEGARSFLLSALRPACDHYVMRELAEWQRRFWTSRTAARPARRPPADHRTTA